MPAVDFTQPRGVDILAQMIQTVVTAEELEPEEEEEVVESLGPGRRPSLKVLFVETNLQVQDLVSKLYQTASSSTRIRNLLDSFLPQVTPKGDGYFLLSFKEREMGRPFQYLIRVGDGAWEVYTIERATDVVRTFRRMVEDSDLLDMAWVPREKLDRIVEELVSPDAVSGFTAKRHTGWSRKRVTVRVFGGDRADLGTARKYFHSEPTAVYFKKTHSPEVALLGTLIDNGELRIDKIAPDAIDDFTQTEAAISTRIVTLEYGKLFGGFRGGVVGQLGSAVVRGDSGEVLGEVPRGYHTIVFRISDQYWHEALEASIRSVFVDGKEGSFLGYEFSPGVIRTYDQVFGGSFDVRMDPEEKSVMVDPLPGATEKSISNLSRIFIDRIEHSAKLESVHQVFW